MRKFKRVGLLLCAVLLVSAVPIFTAASPTALTIDFGSAQVVLAEKHLLGGWYNYADWYQLTGGKSLFSRATHMTGDDTFAGTFPDLVQAVERLAPQYETPAFDGDVRFAPHGNPQFTVVNQRAGRVIDRERLYQDILQALKGNQFPVVKATYRATQPTPAAEIIKAITKRSEFSTRCTANPDRETNIALALGKFDGLKVAAGESVSFNQIVGQRTAAQGFKEAKIIVGGEYVDGIGGGVCQVSTTIFNAVVQAGLPILESHHHTLPSSYVPLGQDAMVSSGADLRFTNNSGAPIYFATRFQNHTLTVTIYGRSKGNNITYRLDTDKVKTLPIKETWAKSVTAAQIKAYQTHPANFRRVQQSAGQAGYVVDTYLETYQGARRLSRKLLRRSTYQPQPAEFILVDVSGTPDDV